MVMLSVQSVFVMELVIRRHLCVCLFVSSSTHRETATFMDVLEDSGIDRSSSSSSKLSLRQISTTRFDEEFHILETVGNGQFGVVYKCVNRMDGCTYAVKKSRFPVAGSSYE